MHEYANFYDKKIMIRSTGTWNKKRTIMQKGHAFFGHAPSLQISDRFSIDRLEHFLALLTQRADPVLGQVFECRSGLDAVVGIAQLRIVDVSAHFAFVLFHGWSFWLNMLCVAKSGPR